MSGQPFYGFLTHARRPATFAVLAALSLTYVLFNAAYGAENAPQQMLDAAGRIPARIWLGEWWRLPSSLFVDVHAHQLALNCLALLVFGSYLETHVGSVRWLLIFFVSGLAAAVLSLAQPNPQEAAGASGAVVGILVATLAVLGRQSAPPDDESEWMRLALGMAAALGILAIVGTGTWRLAANAYDYAGGFAAGALLSLLLGTSSRRERPWQIASVGVLLVLGMLGAAQVLQPQPRFIAWHHYVRASSAFNGGDAATAREELMRSLAWTPDAALPHYLLALVYAQAGWRIGYAAELHEARRLEPANADILEEVAQWNTRSGNVENAIELLRLVVELEPRRARAHVRLAEALQLTGQPRDAARSYAAALKHEPRHPQALYGLASIFQDALGQADSARVYWKLLAERDPIGPDESYQVARAHLQLGDAARCKALLDAAMARDTRLDSLYVLRAITHAELRDFKGAVADAERAVQLVPKSWSRLYVRARVLSWWRREAPGQIPAARVSAAYEAALANARSPWQMALTRGFKALETAVPSAAASAERNARTAIKLRPADADSWFLLALALRRQGKASESAAALEQARRREPHMREYR